MAEVTWLRNGEPLTPDDRVKVTSDGKKHTLTIDKSILDDATKYTIKIGEVESTAKLTVEGRLEMQQWGPISLILCAFTNLLTS